jgi:hypothetical protein
MRPFVVLSGCFALLSALSASAPAQCVPLGTPTQNACHLGGPPFPALTCVGTPNVGNASFTLLEWVSCLNGGSFLLVGPCAAPPVPITGPFGTNAFCQSDPAATCLLWVDPNSFGVLLGLPVSTGIAYPVPIPNDPSLVGGTACAQAGTICNLFVGSCVALTPGLSITILP